MRLILLIFFSQLLVAKPYFPKEITRYVNKNNFCPQKVVEEFSFYIISELDSKKSLFDIKKLITENKTDEKMFVSSYKITIHPVNKKVIISTKCAPAIARVEIYKENGDELYSAILGSDGKLYDPNYENILKLEDKISGSLPVLALGDEYLNEELLKGVSSFVSLFGEELKKDLSEIILSSDDSLTLIFSWSRNPTNVFLGRTLWSSKLDKLKKIFSYFKKTNKYPRDINLVNAKKVVVKFPDKI